MRALALVLALVACAPHRAVTPAIPEADRLAAEFIVAKSSGEQLGVLGHCEPRSARVETTKADFAAHWRRTFSGPGYERIMVVFRNGIIDGHLLGARLAVEACPDRERTYRRVRAAIEIMREGERYP